MCPFKRAGRTGYVVKHKYLAEGLDHVTSSFPSLSGKCFAHYCFNVFPKTYGYCLMNFVYFDIMGNSQICQLNFFSMNVVLTWVFPFNNIMFLQHTVQTKEVLKCISNTWQIHLLKHTETSLFMEIIRLFL